LSIFPILFLLIWFFLSLPKNRRFHSIPSLLIFFMISAAIFQILPAQVGARPKQFQKSLNFGEELHKIFDFNISMLWNPVHFSSGIQFAMWFSVAALGMLSVWYAIKHWDEFDKRISSLMIGLAVAPSAGILALDWIFDKDLGKSSYVLFAAPAVVFLLTVSAGFRRAEATDPAGKWSSPSRFFVVVVPFFVGLQLTGINFDLERTPNFAGSTIRSLAAKIEASSPPPLVVMGAGHGRGDPATLIYELLPETTVCVVSTGSDLETMRREIAAYDNVWIVFAKGRKTDAVEDALYESLTRGGGYRVVSRAKRLAQLRKRE
jgi:hypothetical protein